MTVTNDDIEILLDDFMDMYGYDFSGYSRASFKRRIERVLMMDKLLNFSEFRFRLRNEPAYFHKVVTEISVSVTEMFRDPKYFKLIRESVLPELAVYPLIRIWHAGCATGEEVYTMAILLEEAGLLEKTLLYGTDINPIVLKKAREGIFPLLPMQQYSRNYQRSGGEKEFSNYYTAHYSMARFNEHLSKRMIFSTHNLVTDWTFNSFQLIFCRNVLIYFERALQSRVLSLFDRSLEKDGFLALGSKESIRFSGIAHKYKQLEQEKIWRKTI
jgi:chemotaxis protein methyltransferase CheR